MLVGAPVRATGLSPHDLMVREVTVLTTFSHDREADTEAAMGMLAGGRLRLDHLVTEVVALSHVVDLVFRRPASGFKTVVDPA